MKSLFILLFSFIGVAASGQMRKADVQHYRFDIQLTDSSDLIQGIASVRFKLDQRMDSLMLDLISTDTGRKGMQVTDVLMDGRQLKWNHKGNKLHILLPGGLTAGNQKEVQVSYRGIPKDGLIISTNKFGERTFFADNWPDRARNWIPCVDDPADKASVEFIVTAPIHYQVVSNGLQIEETVLSERLKLTHWKEDALLPTKIMVIGAARFAVQYVGDTLGVPVYSWVYPQEKDKVFYDYAQAKDILPFFINNITYRSVSFFGGVASHLRFLKQMGKK